MYSSLCTQGRCVRLGALPDPRIQGRHITALSNLPAVDGLGPPIPLGSVHGRHSATGDAKSMRSRPTRKHALLARRAASTVLFTASTAGVVASNRVLRQHDKEGWLPTPARHSEGVSAQQPHASPSRSTHATTSACALGSPFHACDPIASDDAKRTPIVKPQMVHSCGRCSTDPASCHQAR